MSTFTGSRREWFGSGAINGASPVILRTPRDVGSTLYITKLTVSITTHAAGKIVGFEDSSDTEIIYAKHTDAAAGAGVPSVITWDFGKWGIPVVEGMDVMGFSEGSGPSGWFYAEGWEDIGGGNDVTVQYPPIP